MSVYKLIGTLSEFFDDITLDRKWFSNPPLFFMFCSSVDS